MQYVVCLDCGAHLDFGESCDCTKKEATPQPREQPPSKTTILSLSASKKTVKERGHANER